LLFGLVCMGSQASDLYCQNAIPGPQIQWHVACRETL